MKCEVKRLAAAMIIAMAAVWPAQAQQLNNGMPVPSPIAFANEMELGNVERATEWLDAGLPPDFAGVRIGTGLMIGAWEGKLELMRLFLSRGADIDKLNANGESALALAALRGKFEAVKWLLERGARINGGPRQWSALHYAVFGGHKEIADYLMARGADVNALSTNGSSVLMMAVREGKEDLVRTLLEKGADRSVKNDWGDGALEWSMRYERLNIARMVSKPEEFNIAVAQPKEKWGPPVRSLASSKELDNLMNMRRQLVERNMPTDTIDRRIAAERVRIVRADMDAAKPQRAATLEVTANRKAPEQQSTQVIYDDKGKPVGFKAPPTTYYGTPKMPPAGKVKNY